MSSIVQGGAAGFEIGRVIADSAAFAGRRSAAVVGLTLIVGWAPQVAIVLVAEPLRRFWTAPEAPAVWSLGFFSISLLAGLLARTAVVGLALAPPEPPSDASDAVGSAVRALPVLLPYWLIASAPTLVAQVMSSTGTGSLFRAGLLVAWAALPLSLLYALLFGVLAPVAVAERRGLLGSTARAVRLLSGGRLKFLALYLMIVVLGAVANYAIALVLNVAAPMSPSQIGTVLAWRQVSVSLASDLIQALWAILTAMSYRQLVRLHDGPDAHEAAAVFG